MIRALAANAYYGKRRAPIAGRRHRCRRQIVVQGGFGGRSPLVKPADKPGLGQLHPEGVGFRPGIAGRCIQVPAVVAAVDRLADRISGIHRVPVARYVTVAILESEVCGLDGGGGRGDGAHARTLNHLPTLEDATDEQGDDDQYQGGLDQGKS